MKPLPLTLSNSINFEQAAPLKMDPSDAHACESMANDDEKRAEALMVRVRDQAFPLHIKAHRKFLKVHKACFTGAQLVDAMLTNPNDNKESKGASETNESDGDNAKAASNSGVDATKYFAADQPLADSREAAVELGKLLVKQNHLHHVSDS